MTLDEQLSRLLDGDLPDAHARALRARIADEPAVATAWAELRALRDDLRALPTEMPPPPIDPAGFPPSRARGRGWRALPWILLAAALALLVVRPPSRSRPTVALGIGTSEVTGRLSLVAGDVRVDVDGSARIIVEPAPGVVREGGQDNPEEPMDVRMVGAALAGVVVTVGVLEGTALVQRPGASPAELAPGHPETFGGAGGAAASAASAPAPAAAPGDRAALQGRVAALEAELAEARAALDAERFTGELVRGQLTRLQGVPSEWPDDGVPEPLRPANFEASVQEQLRALEGIALDRVSCEEYPCIAVVRHTQPVEGDLSEHDDWDAGAQDALRSWLTSEIGDDLSVTLNRSRFRSGDVDRQYMIFAAYDAPREGPVGTRTEFRVDDLVETLGAEIKAAAGAE